MVKRPDSSVDNLVGEILADAPAAGAAELAAWRKPAQALRKLVRRDYVRDLRRNLGYGELRALLKAVDPTLPGLNREPIGAIPVDKQAEVATHLQIHFKAAPHAGRDGLALRGFYVNSLREVLKRPLIYVNTAHHPLAVSATFCHEIGHHFATDILRHRGEKVHFFFDADYSQHMRDPAELAADILVSLAGYPEVVARAIFAKPWNWGLVARTEGFDSSTLGQIQAYLSQVYDLDLTKGVSTRQKINYMSGMIHYAKLRWALLAEFDL